METNKGYMAEGHSVTRPPFFDGTDYPYWKNRMQDEDTWSKDQIAKGTLNWSALNMMQYAVHPKEYSRVSTCTSAKEMWDKLELIYEGTSQVRESKISLARLRSVRGRRIWIWSLIGHKYPGPSQPSKPTNGKKRPLNLTDGPSQERKPKVPTSTTPNNKPRCKHCDKLGHTTKECWRKAGACLHCGSREHRIPECPLLKENEKRPIR
ncbi:hypothetical protein Taro_042583 [Colocasia esculenta]|uniref:CCHC-type domain-containing protein n=1 Tax=Colocasia esculenta TaxID=4460 RepID=A0A843WYV4_COLES|nr:hypothetical protein [Colocasia esculenta]